MPRLPLTLRQATRPMGKMYSSLREAILPGQSWYHCQSVLEF